MQEIVIARKRVGRGWRVEGGKEGRKVKKKKGKKKELSIPSAPLVETETPVYKISNSHQLRK